MHLPEKYVILVDFFLDKRNVTKGGVEGFSTPFDFSLQELEDATGIPRDDLPAMLKVFCKERVTTSDGPEYLIERISQNANVITIENCTTEKLIKYRKKIVAKSGVNLLKVDQRKKTITYLNNTYRFSKGNRWRAFEYLWLEHPNPVSYRRLYVQLYSGKKKNTVYANKDKKIVQNVIAGLTRDMAKHGFVNIFENNPKQGYRLKSVFY